MYHYFQDECPSLLISSDETTSLLETVNTNEGESVQALSENVIEKVGNRNTKEFFFYINS